MSQHTEGSRLILAALGLALAALSHGCTVTSATSRASLKAVATPGQASPSVEASIVWECSWGRGSAAKN